MSSIKFSIKQLIIIFLIISVILCLIHFIPLVDSTETLTLTPIACASISNFGDVESEMLVYFAEGVKFVSYFIFNTSSIPAGASIDSAILKVKTSATTLEK